MGIELQDALKDHKGEVIASGQSHNRLAARAGRENFWRPWFVMTFL
jgi:hypothetical protein